MFGALKTLLSTMTTLARSRAELVLEIAALRQKFAERQVRSPVMGRWNHLGSHSVRGAHVSALFYSLVGSCRLVNVSPLDYLTTLVERGLADKTYALLPHEFAEELVAK